MERLTIAKKTITPFVDLDPDTAVLVFQGESYPENVIAFYRPVLDWLKAYFDQVDDQVESVLQVSLNYMNTSSAKVFMMIFDLCQEAVARKKRVSIDWKHHREDLLIREMGEDLSYGLQVPFRFIAEE